MTRTIFLGSAPSGSSELTRGLETSRIVLGSLQPGQAPHVFVDALGRLEGRLTYLNKGNGRWWLDVRPNLRQEMEERKKRFDDAAVLDEIRSAINRVTGTSQIFRRYTYSPGTRTFPTTGSCVWWCCRRRPHGRDPVRIWRARWRSRSCAGAGSSRGRSRIG